MTTIDLHIHSIYSDGLLSPAELCALAVRRHVSVVALCDHDTLAGTWSMTEAAAAQTAEGHPLDVLPALELSSGAEGRIHILGYGATPGNRILSETLARGRTERRDRYAEILHRLKKMGIEIPSDRLPEGRPDSMPISRAHIARALIGIGLVNTMEQAFDKYLGEGKPAYVPLCHLSAEEAVRLLVSAGVVPVLAHPMRIGLTTFTLEALVASLRAVGLAGIEVFHPSASRSDIPFLLRMARNSGLLVTGGSDYHGDHDTRTQIGRFPSGWTSWQDDLQALKVAIENRAPVQLAVGND